MPLKVLYLFSDVFFLIAYHVARYRKDDVLKNLTRSFPEKTPEELRNIRRQFFLNFSDYIVETSKAFTISEDELRFRIQHINQELFHEAKKEGKNIILLAGHVFNWEWINVLARIVPQQHCHPVYRKVSDNFLEEKMRFVRNRFGNHSLEANDVIKHILSSPNDGNSIYMFIADQTPHISQVRYGLTFLNQKTPAFIGYDKLSTKKDLVFIYCDMKKVRRGFYQVNYQRIHPDGERFERHEVVKKFHKMLEKTIRKDPSNWLWSHRRWKYSSAIKDNDQE